MPVNSNTIRLERHAEIGQLIRDGKDIILDRWSHRAIEEQPNAKRVHHAILLDQLSDFLLALATSLAEKDDLETSLHRIPALQHGEQRWEVGWSLPELVSDYQLLRIVLLDFLHENLSRPLRPREVMALGLALDDAIAASVGIYVSNREDYIRLLERTQVERERKAEEAVLRRQNENLEDTNRRKDDFLANLGHELRNPLSPIRNAVHVLRLREPDAATLEWVKDVVERQVQHMTRLVDDLLEITRITRGKLHLQREPVDLAQQIRATVQDQSTTLKEAGVTLKLDLPHEPVWLHADPVRIAQIIFNLVQNAGKFTDPGGEVNVQLIKQQQEQRAVVTVKDTGVGIDPEILPHIFETFRQADTNLERNRQGLGLGLAVVKGLVELHGGTISASSRGPGQGAEFTFWLPLQTGHVKPSTPSIEPQPVARSLRILIVDDNCDSADSQQKLLSMVGHQVMVAYSGPSALETARHFLPDVVLCDIGLPEMDGCAVARAMKSDLSTAHFRLIAVSGYGSDADHKRCKEAGFERLLAKPVDPDELQRVLALSP